MSVIFPGNYVQDLNAYRDQGVLAVPGVEFYQLRGAAVLSADVSGSGDLALQILSPDKRGDDKPRLDKTFKIPAGAKVYRTAITAVNVKSTGTNALAVNGLVANTALEASLAASGGVYPTAGATNAYAPQTVSAESAERTITASHAGAVTIVDPSETAAVIVEVCYYLDGAAPVTDDIALPYKVEAGQGT